MIVLTNGRQKQILICGDLMGAGGVEYETLFRQHKSPIIVYSDPPWNPGNLKWWWRHANLSSRCADFQDFMNRWAELAQGAVEIFCEQSSNEQSQAFLLRAIERLPDFPPLLEKFSVSYAGGRYPNQLLHFGKSRVFSDPTGMYGEKMTQVVFEGIADLEGWVVDPCIGKGMTSRMAHRFGMNCLGLELNPHRLETAKTWLIRNGYS